MTPPDGATISQSPATNSLHHLVEKLTTHIQDVSWPEKDSEPHKYNDLYTQNIIISGGGGGGGVDAAPTFFCYSFTAAKFIESTPFLNLSWHLLKDRYYALFFANYKRHYWGDAGVLLDYLMIFPSFMSKPLKH